MDSAWAEVLDEREQDSSREERSGIPGNSKAATVVSAFVMLRQFRFSGALTAQSGQRKRVFRG
jgi:hypothetical protein